MTRCPFCAEDIRAAAIICRFCGRALPPAVSTAEAASQVEAAAGGDPGQVGQSATRTIVASRQLLPGGLSKFVVSGLLLVVALAVLGWLAYRLAPSTSSHGKLKAYLESPTVDERFKHICPSPQISVEDLRAYYLEGLPPLSVTEIEAKDTPSDSDVLLTARWVMGPQKERAGDSFWVHKGPRGWCVDWISLPRLRPGLAEAFDDGSVVRGFVSVSLDDYYNGAFLGAEGWAYSLAIEGMPRPTHAYLERAAPGASVIFGALKSGGSRRIKGTFAFPAHRILGRQQGILALTDAELVQFEPPR